jgi:hypothetical protein
MLALTSFATAIAFLGFAVAQDSSFVCERRSDNNAGNLIEKMISLEFCLDSDPVPVAIFEPGPLNTFTKINFENGGEDVVFHLEAGHYIIASGAYISSIYVYEKDCQGGGKKAPKGTEDGQEDGQEDGR